MVFLIGAAVCCAEDTEYHVTFLSSRGECNKQTFSHKDLADAHLLDHIRGAMSFGHKAFALVENGDTVSYVIVEGNCTEWLSPAQFFQRVRVEDFLGNRAVNLQIADNR